MQQTVNVNRPMNQQGGQPSGMNSGNSGSGNQNNGSFGSGGSGGSGPSAMRGNPFRSPKVLWITIAAIVIIILVILAIIFRDKFTKPSTTYQAVFLSNGQVYFGHLTHAKSEFAQLTDIYYLQVNQNQAQTQNPQNGQPAAAQANQKLSLVKLGNEVHGPTDQMQINRSQILFYEDLRDDGKVVRAIYSYKLNGGNPATDTTGTGVGNGVGTPPAGTATPTPTSH